MTRALVLAWLALSLAAEARPRRPRAAPGSSEGPGVLATGKLGSGPGQVTYLTADGVYIDRGAADGLKAGDKVQLVRSGRALGACTVGQLNEHTAVCSGGAGFTVGDRISVERKAEAPATPLAPVPDARQLASRLAAVEAAPVGLVEFAGGAPVGSGAASTVQVTISHTTFSDLSSANGPYQLQRVDAALNELHLWRGLHVSADLSVLNWSRRPAIFRSPLKGTPQVFVRRAEVSWHERGGVVRAALGRVWTRGTPGLSVLDGAQAGLTTRDGQLEAGAFGGALPDPLSLGFSAGSWAVGAYAFGRFFRGTGADAIWVQPELRAGWSMRNGIGGRFEVAASLHGWVGRNFDLHLMAQAGLGAVNALDVARVDLGVRASDRFRLLAALRYRGTPGGEVLEVGSLFFGARAVHADGQVLFEVSRGLVLAISGGYARDFDTGLSSGRVGPELQLPTLFGKGGLAFGYSEELGWIRGRSGYAQVTLVPHWRVRLIARGVWLNQQGPSDGLAGHELGATASFEARFAPWLWLRLSGLVRARLDKTGAAAQGSAQLGFEI